MLNHKGLQEHRTFIKKHKTKTKNKKNKNKNIQKKKKKKHGSVTFHNSAHSGSNLPIKKKDGSLAKASDLTILVFIHIRQRFKH